MKHWKHFLTIFLLVLSFFTFPLVQQPALADEMYIPVVVSTGTIFIVDPVSHYVMIQKENGKKVSLELTSETSVFLNGENLSLDKLIKIKKDFLATAEHFTNDAGMQQTVWLKVNGEAGHE
ncbi:MAG: hypothetical protein GTN53_15475 [Candidatus Aminicenantes bacterium]|nr:hypothetical protein [Candidatus Aminicenantes bacterium]